MFVGPGSCAASAGPERPLLASPLSGGGFAYNAGRPAEFSRNSVLGGAGHRGGNRVGGVGRGPGVGARAAGEGTWGETERGVGAPTETEALRREAGLDGLLIPACFAMQVAAPITEITQFVDFTPALTKPTAPTARRCQDRVSLPPTPHSREE